jgi:RNA recognition motif-containing protein
MSYGLRRLSSYRDRENSTVFVADLPRGVTDDDLKQLFKDVRAFGAAYVAKC